MGIESLIVFLIIGAIAGWLAGLIVKGYGFGLLGNIVVGIVGALHCGMAVPAHRRQPWLGHMSRLSSTRPSAR